MARTPVTLKGWSTSSMCSYCLVGELCCEDTEFLGHKLVEIQGESWWASLHHIVSIGEGVKLWNSISLFGHLSEYGYLEINNKWMMIVYS
jgi:hypothetical protein